MKKTRAQIEKQHKTQGNRRASDWGSFRKKHLAGKVCAVCGGKKKLELHHIIPFHQDRSKEKDPSNVIPLCENKKDGINCHLAIGHLGCFRSYNPEVIDDSFSLSYKIKNRPK